MDMFIHALSWIFLMGGVFLGLSGALGVVRFPDFYTRLHAASVTDTLCAALILGGLMLQAGWGLVSAKLFLILLFLWYTSPASSHALVRAAHHMGLSAYQPDRGGSSSSR